MNVWLYAATGFVIALGLAAIVAMRGRLVDRLIGLELASTFGFLALLTIEMGLQRQSFFDLSLMLAVLTVPSTLLFARFFARWL